MDSNRLVDIKPRVSDDTDRIKAWRIPDIVDPSHLKVLRLTDAITAGKVGTSISFIKGQRHSFWLKG